MLGTRLLAIELLVCLTFAGALPAAEPLAGTAPLTVEGDLAAQMVDGCHKFLDRLTAESVESRARHWRRDLSSHEAYLRSIEPNRQRLRRILGLREQPLRHPLGIPKGMDLASLEEARGATQQAAGGFETRQVDGGLILVPAGEPMADVIALADAEAGAGVPAWLARHCRVVAPILINRSDELSLVGGERRTNQPHREFVYRQAYEMGRHIIGYEIDLVSQIVTQLLEAQQRSGQRRPIAIYGYGEGGLVALYAAAVDPRIDLALVSGYFDDRQQLWREPIYRNVWGLLTEFGDAEIASLIAPRPLLIEACAFPPVAGPPQPADGKRGAAPGRLETPSLQTVQKEAARARQLTKGLTPPPVVEVVASGDGAGPSGSAGAINRLLELVGSGDAPVASDADTAVVRPEEGFYRREHARRFQELVEYTQFLMRESEYVRREFWNRADASSLENWQKSTEWYRNYFSQEVIGEFADQRLPPRPRSRQVEDQPKYRGYEVLLDVFPDVFAYGILLVPKDIRPGERRPVVVCQHGLEGRPQDVADPRVNNPAYHQFACQLAERGYITYAPQNPYIGEDRFRSLQRKANPLRKSLFSIIVPQHRQAVDWLASLPMVDGERIAFYGLSYGGKTAMRVPALVEKYCLSICSADFNEWIWKNVSNRAKYSYLGTGEYEMVEFDLGNTFNYAEMAALIAPRPFMVERGHDDGVAPDEWVAYEYAKVRRLYAALKIPDRTTIEFFDGPHTIHGVGTFEFLGRQLMFPNADGR
ncbi:MAG: acetylxylan esterase [Pirellulales bacterium]|nr:acetylxylan esterase [Pirellulales bacterium]